MGASHLKSGRSRIRGNNLYYEIFRGVNCEGFFFFFYENGLEAASGFRFDLPWMWKASFLSTYLSQPVGL